MQTSRYNVTIQCLNSWPSGVLLINFCFFFGGGVGKFDKHFKNILKICGGGNVLRLMNLAWDFLGVNLLSKDCFGFCWKP